MTTSEPDAILVLDCETTGLDPAVDAVVEVAAVRLEFDRCRGAGGGWVLDSHGASLVDPGRSVPATASAVHHLTNRDLKGARPLARVLAEDVKELWTLGTIVAAHRASFDASFLNTALVAILGHPLGQWLCTHRLALHLYPDEESRALQVLRYALPGLDDEYRAMATWRGALLDPHRAYSDALLAALLLRRMLAGRTLADLVALAPRYALLRRVGFGKHRGKEWSAVPRDYLQWVLRAEDLDADVKFTARYWLGGDRRPPSGDPLGR